MGRNQQCMLRFIPLYHSHSKLMSRTPNILSTYFVTNGPFLSPMTPWFLLTFEFSARFKETTVIAAPSTLE